MSLLEDIQSKIEKAHDEVRAITSELNEFASLKSSLKSTDEGVRGAAQNLDRLSETLTRGSAALDRASQSLTETNDLIRKTDPAEILKSLSSIETSQEQHRKDLEDLIQSQKSEIEKSLDEKNEKLSRAVLAELNSTKNQLDTKVGSEISGLASLLQSATSRQKLLTALVFLNLAISAALAYRFFQ